MFLVIERGLPGQEFPGAIYEYPDGFLSAIIVINCWSESLSGQQTTRYGPNIESLLVEQCNSTESKNIGRL